MKAIGIIGLSVVSAGIGFGAGLFVTKKKYERLMDEAVESVKKVYTVKRKVNHVKIDENRETVEARETRKEDERNAPEIAAFNNLKQESEYVDYSGYSENEDAKDVVTLGKEDTKDGLVIVSPEEFEEDEGYRTLNLSYYDDGVLADESDNVIENCEMILGHLHPEDLLPANEESVFLRDDIKQLYIEIVKDDRTFYGDIMPDEED